MAFDPQLGAPSKQITFTIDISANTTISAESHNIEGYNTFIVSTPAALTSTALGWRHSGTAGGTFATLKDNAGVAATITVETATAEELSVDSQAPAMALAAASFIQVEMGTAELADRTITMTCHQ